MHVGDHLSHSVSIRSNTQLHGRGFWKFPRYLLECPKVVSAIEGEAEQVLDQLRRSENPKKIYENWKKSVKTQLQDVQKKLRQQDTREIEDARVTLDQAAARYRALSGKENRDFFDEVLRSYKDTPTGTRQHNHDASFDFQVNNSERSTSHFFRHLDTSLRRVSIDEAITPSGNVSANPQEMSLRFLEHWGSEMGDVESPTESASEPNVAQQRILLDSISRVVPVTSCTALEADLTTADLATAIPHMRATSSPGMDGLAAGFYQVAPSVFGECLAIVFKDRLRRGELLASQRKSAVVLQHKKGSRVEPGNYRPVALVPVDVNVLSKALTYRYQKVMLDLIYPDQKGFVKTRSIHHHVRFLADLQDLVTNRDEEAYALFLDFQKTTTV